MKNKTKRKPFVPDYYQQVAQEAYVEVRNYVAENRVEQNIKESLLDNFWRSFCTVNQDCEEFWWY